MLNATGGVFQGQKVPAADGSGVYTSFDDFVDRTYKLRGSVDTPATGNGILNTYITNLTGTAPPANQQFSNALISQIDAFQQIAGTHAAIVTAQALHLSLS